LLRHQKKPKSLLKVLMSSEKSPKQMKHGSGSERNQMAIFCFLPIKQRTRIRFYVQTHLQAPTPIKVENLALWKEHG